MFLKIKDLIRQSTIPPEGVSPEQFRYCIVSRMSLIYLFVGHLFYIPTYMILGGKTLLFFNLFHLILDVFCLRFNLMGYLKSVFAIQVTTFAFHSALGTVYYGWHSGFHYFFLSLVLFVFLAPWKRSIKISIVAFFLLVFILLHWHSQNEPAVISLSLFKLNGITYMNFFSTLFTICIMAYYFSQAAEKAEAALRESESTLKTILDASPIGIALFKDRAITWGNEMAAKMLDYEPSEIIGMKAEAFYPDAKDLARFDKILYKSEHSTGIDLPDAGIYRKDGTILYCMARIEAIKPGDPLFGSIVAFMDTSELKAIQEEKKLLEERVQRAKKMEALGVLAGGVAHDLNNILSGIVSYPELLLMDLADDDPMTKPIMTIKKSGERAAVIVDDLLTLARRGVTVKEPLDLNRVVKDYLKSPEFEKLKSFYPDISVETLLDSGLSNIKASPVHLEKVIMNLVANAVESMPDGGSIFIKTENCYLDKPLRGYDEVKEGHYVLISVRDRGSGISPEDLERIFEPFYTKKVMGRSGTGLGLAVIWGTVKDCDGYIDVKSAENEGATFSLFFPIAGKTGTDQEKTVSLDDLKGHGEKVLIIDDVEEQREIATSMLSRLNYETVSVKSGEEAIDYLSNSSADILVLDMIMGPGMDGLDAYRAILEKTPGQKAIVASGFSETDRVKEAQRLGAGTYIKKPYTLTGIGRAVKEELKRDIVHSIV